MKVKILFILKIGAISLLILLLLIVGLFSWLKWFASESTKVAVGRKMPLLMMIDNQPVNEEEYLSNKQNSSTIYTTNGEGRKIYPLIKFSPNLTPLTKLCLLDFTGDPVYKSFELQQLPQDNKVYYVLIMYRQDNEIDICYESGLNVTKENYRSLMNDVTLIETKFDKVNFEVGENGVDVYAALKDKSGRSIEFKMKDQREQGGEYNIVAPIGAGSIDPEYFPIIYLKNINFVSQKNSEIFVKIDGKDYEPIKLIPFYNYSRVYLSRYCSAACIKLLNKEFTGTIKPVAVTEDVKEITYDDNTYEIENNNGYPEIKSVKSLDGNSEMRINFSPALPDIVSLKDNVNLQGHFTVGVDNNKGILGGEYSISKNKDRIELQMKPKKGWQPMPGNLWMKSYLLNCDIKILNNELLVDCKWKRTE